MHKAETRRVTSVGRVPALVSRHVEEAAFLWDLRRAVARSPALRLVDLEAIDERLETHVDGLRVAGVEALRQSDLALGRLGSGEAFVATLLAIEDGCDQALARNLSIADANPTMRAGTVSALGWSSPAQLRGLVLRLLSNQAESFHRLAGITACCRHSVDPGDALDDAFNADDPALRSAAFRACGELARLDRLDRCLAARQSEAPSVRFWAAWSAVLLGDRGDALSDLVSWSRHPGPYQDRSGRLAFAAMAHDQAADEYARSRSYHMDAVAMVNRAAWLGDVAHVPRLIRLMQVPQLAKPAGSAFGFITGVDLRASDLTRHDPFDDLTNEPVEHAQVPKPDARKVAQWWHDHGARFESGQRLFLGRRTDAGHCLGILREGGLAYRRHAAEYRCLTRRGVRLFNVEAPAWRQAANLSDAV